MNHTKIIFAFALLVLFLYTASAAPIDSNTTDSNAIPAGNGYIYITSIPSGADVYIVDLDVNKDYYFYFGKTPVGTLLAARTFKIIVEMAGYKKYTTELIISEYGSTLLRVELQKSDANAASYGKIKVTSSPSKADVYVDGRYGGLTPLMLKDIATGKHTVLVKKKGYKDYSKTVEVKEDRTAPMHAKLTKISTKKSTTSAKTTGAATASISKVNTGKLKVTSSPSKADAYIRDSEVGDWSSIGKTPVTKSMAAGSYEVSVKKKGYLEARQKVSVSAKKTTAVKIKLQKEAKVKCTDSDGGRDYYVEGVAKGIVDGLETLADDTCLEITKEGYLTDSCSGSGCYLNEGYCEGSTPLYESWVPCTNGCNMGACLESSNKRCTDTDDYNIYIQGKVTIYNDTYPEGYTFKDACYSDKIVSDVVCISPTSDQTDVLTATCPDGYSCDYTGMSNPGACVKATDGNTTDTNTPS